MATLEVTPRVISFYLAYWTGQSVDLTVIGNPVFTLSCDLSFPYHVINGTKGLNNAFLIFRHLQYLLIQYRVSNWTVFSLHNERKSFLSSILPVARMRTYTSCDDVSRWRRAAFSFAENRSNAAQNENHLIKVEFRHEIGKINNQSLRWEEDRENPRDEPPVLTSPRLGPDYRGSPLRFFPILTSSMWYILFIVRLWNYVDTASLEGTDLYLSYSFHSQTHFSVLDTGVLCRTDGLLCVWWLRWC